MTRNQFQLSQRRQYLILKAEKQRIQISQVVDVWREPLTLVDKGLAILNNLKKHPLWIIGSGVVLFKLIGAERTGKWLSRGFVAWQLMRKIQK